MARRIHIPVLRTGDLPLDPVQAHHARDVLRLADGAQIDVFDDDGRSAQGILHIAPGGMVTVRIDHVTVPEEVALEWIVAAAVPKGDRSDWMVEKLSELGAAAFIPLNAARSVVLPGGKSKRERWMRIATESAKQCGRVGVMRIDDLQTVQQTIQKVRAAAAKTDARTSQAEGWALATEIPGMTVTHAIARLKNLRNLTLFVGPEGGWTQQEIFAFELAGMIPVRLGATILRIETAAIAASAVVSALVPGL